MIDNKEKSLEQKFTLDVLSFVDNNWPTVVFFVKNNLNLKSKELVLSLLTLLDDNRNNLIQEELSINERIMIKDILSKKNNFTIQLDHLKKLLTQLRKYLITPKEDEIENLISELSIEDIIKLCTSNPDEMSGLLTMIKQEQLNEIYQKIPMEVLQIFTESALKKDYIDKELIKKRLGVYVKTMNQSFLLKNLSGVFEGLSPDKESIILNYLIEQRNWDELEKICTGNFPEQLFSTLEPEIQKHFFQSLVTEFKIDLIFSHEPEERDKIHEMIAPSGSKIAEIIKMEMQGKENDKSYLEHIKQNKQKIKKSFLIKLRAYLEENHQGMIENIVGVWIKELKELPEKL